MRHEQYIGVELSGEQSRGLLRLLVRRFGSIRKLAQGLGVSKSSLHRLLKGKRISGTTARIVYYRVCKLLGEDEFYSIINREQLLRSIGLLDAVPDREEARGAVLVLVAKRYKTELRQMPGEALPRIRLEWSEGVGSLTSSRKLVDSMRRAGF